MPTPTTVPATAGNHLTPACIDLHQAELDHLTIDVHTCPNGGLLHTDPACGHCLEQCNHHQHGDLQPTTMLLSDADGHLCQCVTSHSINGIDQPTWKALGYIAMGLEAVTRLHAQATTALTDPTATVAERERTMCELNSSFDGGRRNAHDRDFDSQFTEYINQRYDELSDLYQPLQAQLHETTDDDQLRRRMAAMAAVVPVQDTPQVSNIDHQTLLTQEANILADAGYEGSSLILAADIDQLRGTWRHHVTVANSSDDHIIETVAEQLAQIGTGLGTNPDVYTATRLVNRWNQATTQLMDEHVGTSRLVAVHGAVCWTQYNDELILATTSAFTAHNMGVVSETAGWQFLIVDTVEFLGLQAALTQARSNLLVDGGPAHNLQQRAAAADVNLDIVLQMLTQQQAERDNSDTPDLVGTQLQARALTTALS